MFLCQSTWSTWSTFYSSQLRHARVWWKFVCSSYGRYLFLRVSFGPLLVLYGDNGLPHSKKAVYYQSPTVELTLGPSSACTLPGFWPKSTIGKPFSTASDPCVSCGSFSGPFSLMIHHKATLESRSKNASTFCQLSIRTLILLENSFWFPIPRRDQKYHGKTSSRPSPFWSCWWWSSVIRAAYTR